MNFSFHFSRKNYCNFDFSITKNVMNQLTKCGLLPSCVESGRFADLEKKSPVLLGDNMVVPAPFGFRPFAQYYNPYTRGCSVLCNHPVDEETKQKANLHHSKNLHLTDGKYRIVIENETESNGNWQNDIFVPEALFRRYTETDSRPVSPTSTSVFTNVTPRIFATQSRRCLTPDPNIHVPEKMQLILDLRKTASQTALGNDSHLFNDNNLFTKWKKESLREKDFVRKKMSLDTNKSNLKHSSIEKNKSTKQIFAQKEKTNKMTSSNNVKNFVDGTSSSPIMKALKEKKKKSVKRLKSKKKDTKRCSSALTKNGIESSLHEPKETQVSTLDDGSFFDVNNECPDIHRQTSDDEDTCEDETEQHSDMDHIQHLEEHMMKRLQKEFKCETLNNNFDEKHSKIFDDLMSKFAAIIPLSRPEAASEIEFEIKKLQREFRLNSIVSASESSSNVAGVFSRRNARFELPMDRMNLEEMTPMEYLKTYVHISKPRLWVYYRTFETHSNSEEHINKQKLFSALVDILGRRLTQEEETLCTDLLICGGANTQIDFQTWCGICAFSERIFCSGQTSEDFKDLRHEIEIADFEFLAKKIQNVSIREELKKILFMIHSS